MRFDAALPFDRRVQLLPQLGFGISTELGAARTGLDPNRLAREHPGLVRFLEIGADLERGVDDAAREWVAAGRPATYHFLDVNLEEAEDLDLDWMNDTAALATSLGAAWLCGDAGLWHVGPRERGHGVLMPPILTRDSADAMAVAVRTLREHTRFEVLPENPPAHVFLGDLHLLDYFARVAERADCGLVLDVAHLAIYQHAMGHDPLTGLDGFALESVVEVHVAGGRTFEHDGRAFIDDDHGLTVLDDTWAIFEAVAARAQNLRAVVLECERNQIDEVLPLFRRAREAWPAGARP
jgi:uncharacterized protein